MLIKFRTYFSYLCNLIKLLWNFCVSLCFLVISLLFFFFTYLYGFVLFYLIVMGIWRALLKKWKVFNSTWSVWKKISLFFFLPFLPFYLLARFFYHLYYFYFWCCSFIRLTLYKISDKIYKILDALLLFLMLVLPVGLEENDVEDNLLYMELFDEHGVSNDSPEYSGLVDISAFYHDYLNELRRHNTYSSRAIPFSNKASRIGELLPPSEENVYTDTETMLEDDMQTQDGLMLYGSELMPYEDIPSGFFPALVTDEATTTPLSKFSWTYPRFFMDEDDAFPYFVAFYALSNPGINTIKVDGTVTNLDTAGRIRDREIWESHHTSFTTGLYFFKDQDFWFLKKFSLEVFNNIDLVGRRKEFVIELSKNLTYKVTHKSTKEIFYIDFTKFFEVMRSVNFSNTTAFKTDVDEMTSDNYVQYMHEVFLFSELNPNLTLFGSLESLDSVSDSELYDGKDHGDIDNPYRFRQGISAFTKLASGGTYSDIVNKMEYNLSDTTEPWVFNHLSFLKNYFGVEGYVAKELRRGLSSGKELNLNWEGDVNFEPSELSYQLENLDLVESVLIFALQNVYTFTEQEAEAFFKKLKFFLFSDLKLKRVRVKFFFLTNKKDAPTSALRRRARKVLTFKSPSLTSRLKFKRFISAEAFFQERTFEFPSNLILDMEPVPIETESNYVSVRFNSNRVSKLRTHVPFLRKFDKLFAILHNRRFKRLYPRLNALKFLMDFLVESYSTLTAKNLISFFENDSSSILSKKFRHAISNNDYKQRKYLYWDPKLSKLHVSRLGFSKKAFLNQAKQVPPLLFKQQTFIETELDKSKKIADLGLLKIENFLRTAKKLSWTNLTFYNFLKNYYFRDRRVLALLNKNFNFKALHRTFSTEGNFQLTASYSKAMVKLLPSYKYALELGRLAYHLPDMMSSEEHDFYFSSVQLKFSEREFKEHMPFYSFDSVFEQLRKINRIRQLKYLKKFDDYKRLLNMTSSSRLHGLHYLNFRGNAMSTRQLLNLLVMLSTFKKFPTLLANPAYAKLANFLVSAHYQTFLPVGRNHIFYTTLREQFAPDSEHYSGDPYRNRFSEHFYRQYIPGWWQVTKREAGDEPTIDNLISPSSVSTFTGSSSSRINLLFSPLFRFYYLELLRHYQYMNNPNHEIDPDRPLAFPYTNTPSFYMRYGKRWKNFSWSSILALWSVLRLQSWYMQDPSYLGLRPEWEILEEPLEQSDDFYEFISYFSFVFEFVYEHFDLFFGSFLFRKIFFKFFFIYLYLTDFWSYVLIFNSQFSNHLLKSRPIFSSLNLNYFSPFSSNSRITFFFLLLLDFFRSNFLSIKIYLFNISFYNYLGKVLTFFSFTTYEKLYRRVIFFYLIYLYCILVESFIFLKPKFIKFLIYLFYFISLYLIFDITDLFEFFFQYVTYLYYYYLNVFLMLKYLFFHLLQLGDLLDYWILYKQGLTASNQEEVFFSPLSYFRMCCVVFFWILFLPFYLALILFLKVIKFLLIYPISLLLSLIFFTPELYSYNFGLPGGFYSYSFNFIGLITGYPLYVCKYLLNYLLSLIPAFALLSFTLTTLITFFFGSELEMVFLINYYYSLILSILNFFWLFFTDNFIQINYVYSIFIVLVLHLKFFLILIFSTCFLWIKYFLFNLFYNPIFSSFFSFFTWIYYFFFIFYWIIIKLFSFFFFFVSKFFFSVKAIFWVCVTIFFFFYNLFLTLITNALSFTEYTLLADFVEMFKFTPENSLFKLDFFYQFSQSILHNFVFLTFFVFGFALDVILSFFGFSCENMYIEILETIPNIFRVFFLYFSTYFYIFDFRTPEFHIVWDLNHYEFISDIYFTCLYIYFLYAYIYLFGLQPYIYYNPESRDMTIDPEFAWYKLTLDDVFWSNTPAYLRELRRKSLFDLTVNHPQLFNEFLGLHDDSTRYSLDGMVESDASTSFAFDSSMFSFIESNDELGLADFESQYNHEDMINFGRFLPAKSEGQFLTHNQFLYNEQGSFNLLEYLEDLLTDYFYSSTYFPGTQLKNSKFLFFQKLFFTTTKQSIYLYDFSSNRWFSELYNYYIMSSELLPFEDFFPQNEEFDILIDAEEEEELHIENEEESTEIDLINTDENSIFPVENFGTLYPYSDTEYDSLGEMYFYFKVLNFSEILLKRKELYRNFLFKKSLDSNLKLHELGERMPGKDFYNASNKDRLFEHSQLNSDVGIDLSDYYELNYFGASTSKYVLTSNSFNYVIRTKLINNPFLLNNNKFLRFYFTTISDTYARELFFFFDYHNNALGSMYSNPLVFWLFLCFPGFSLYLYRTSINDYRLSQSTADYINFFLYTDAAQALWKYDPSLRDLTDLSSYYFFYEKKLYESDNEKYFVADTPTGKKKLYVDASMEAVKLAVTRELLLFTATLKRAGGRAPSRPFKKATHKVFVFRGDNADLVAEYFYNRKRRRASRRNKVLLSSGFRPSDVGSRPHNKQGRKYLKKLFHYNYVNDYTYFKNPEEFVKFSGKRYHLATFSSPFYGRMYKDHLKRLDKIRRSREILEAELDLLLKLSPEKLSNTDAVRLINKWWAINGSDNPDEFASLNPIAYYEATKTIRFLITLPQLYKAWKFDRRRPSNRNLPIYNPRYSIEQSSYWRELDKSLPDVHNTPGWDNKDGKISSKVSFWFKGAELPAQHRVWSRYLRAMFSGSTLNYVNDWSYAKAFDKAWEDFVTKDAKITTPVKEIGIAGGEPISFFVSKEPQVTINEALLLDRHKHNNLKKFKPPVEDLFKGSVLSYFYDLPKALRAPNSRTFVFDATLANFKVKMRLLKAKNVNLSLSDKKELLALLKEHAQFMSQSLFEVEEYLNTIEKISLSALESENRSDIEQYNQLAPYSLNKDKSRGLVFSTFGKEKNLLEKKSRKKIVSIFKPQIFDNNSEYFSKFDQFMRSKFPPEKKNLNILQELYNRDDGIKNRIKGVRPHLFSKKYKSLPAARQDLIMSGELNNFLESSPGWEEALSKEELRHLSKRFVPRRKFIGSPYARLRVDAPYDSFFKEVLKGGSLDKEQQRLKPFYSDHFFYVRRILYTTLSDFRSDRVFLSYLKTNSTQGRIVKRRTKRLGSTEWTPYYKLFHDDPSGFANKIFLPHVTDSVTEFKHEYNWLQSHPTLNQLGDLLADSKVFSPVGQLVKMIRLEIMTLDHKELQLAPPRNRRYRIFSSKYSMHYLSIRYRAFFMKFWNSQHFDEYTYKLKSITDLNTFKSKINGLPYSFKFFKFRKKIMNYFYDVNNRHEFIENNGLSFSYPYGKKYVLNLSSNQYPIAYPVNVFYTSKYDLNLNEQFVRSLDFFPSLEDLYRFDLPEQVLARKYAPTKLISKRKLFKLRRLFKKFNSYEHNGVTLKENDKIIKTSPYIIKNGSLPNLNDKYELNKQVKRARISIASKISDQRLALFDKIRFEPHLGREPKGHSLPNFNLLENYLRSVANSNDFYNGKYKQWSSRERVRKKLLETLPHDILRSETNFSYWDVPYEYNFFPKSTYNVSRQIADSMFNYQTRQGAIDRHRAFKNLIYFWKHIPEEIKYSEDFLRSALTLDGNFLMMRLQGTDSLIGDENPTPRISPRLSDIRRFQVLDFYRRHKAEAISGSRGTDTSKKFLGKFPGTRPKGRVKGLAENYQSFSQTKLNLIPSKYEEFARRVGLKGHYYAKSLGIGVDIGAQSRLLVGNYAKNKMLPFELRSLERFNSVWVPSYDYATIFREDSVKASREFDYAMRNIPFSVSVVEKDLARYRSALRFKYFDSKNLEAKIDGFADAKPLKYFNRKKRHFKLKTALNANANYFGMNLYDVRRYLRSLAFELDKEPIPIKYVLGSAWFNSPIFSRGSSTSPNSYSKVKADSYDVSWLPYYDNKGSLLLFNKLFKRRYWATYNNKRKHLWFKHLRKRKPLHLIDNDLTLFDFSTLWELANPADEYVEQQYGTFYSQDATSLIEADLDLLVSDPFYRQSVYHTHTRNTHAEAINASNHEIEHDIDSFWSFDLDFGFTFFQLLAFNIIRFIVSSGLLDFFLNFLHKLDILIYYQDAPDNMLLKWWTYQSRFAEKDLRSNFWFEESEFRNYIGFFFWWVAFFYNIFLYWPYYYLKKLLLFTFAPFLVLVLFFLSFSNFFSYFFSLLLKFFLQIKLLYLFEYFSKWFNYYYLHILSGQTVNRRYLKLTSWFSRFFKISRGGAETFSINQFQTRFRHTRLDIHHHYHETRDKLSKAEKMFSASPRKVDNFWRRNFFAYNKHLHREDMHFTFGFQYYYRYIRDYILDIRGYVVVVFRFWADVFDLKHKPFLTWFINSENRFFRFFFFPYFKKGSSFENDLLKYLAKRIDTASSNEEAFNLLLKFRQAAAQEMVSRHKSFVWTFLEHGKFKRWDKYWDITRWASESLNVIGRFFYDTNKRDDYYTDRVLRYSMHFPQALSKFTRSLVSLKHIDQFFTGFSKNSKYSPLSNWFYIKFGKSLARRKRLSYLKLYKTYFRKLSARSATAPYITYPINPIKVRWRRHRMFSRFRGHFYVLLGYKYNWTRRWHDELSYRAIRVAQLAEKFKATKLFMHLERTSKTYMVKFRLFLYPIQDLYAPGWISWIWNGDWYKRLNWLEKAIQNSAFAAPFMGHWVRKFKRVLNRRIVFKNIYSMSWTRYRFYKHFLIFSYLYYFVPKVFRLSLFYFYFLLYEYALFIIPGLNLLFLLLFLYLQKIFNIFYLLLQIFYYFPFLYSQLSDFFYNFIFFYFFDSSFLIFNAFNYVIDLFNPNSTIFDLNGLLLTCIFIFRFLLICVGTLTFEIVRIFFLNISYVWAAILLPFWFLQLLKLSLANKFSLGVFSMVFIALFNFLILSYDLDQFFLSFLDLYTELVLFNFIYMSGLETVFFFFLVSHTSLSILLVYAAQVIVYFFSYFYFFYFMILWLFNFENFLFFFMCLKLFFLFVFFFVLFILLLKLIFFHFYRKKK